MKKIYMQDMKERRVILKIRRTTNPRLTALAVLVSMTLTAGCASIGGPYETQRDKTAKGAGIGAAAGALIALADGKREADEILAGAALGAVAGGGVGVYMDAQEEKIARIPGTSVERVAPDVLLVHFDSDLLFAIDSSRLNGESRSSLSRMANVINDYKKTAVVVQGHTDSTGSEGHNQALSVRRASSVEGYLINNGVAPQRITAVGYGETSPRATNSTSYGRQLNRRVDVLLRAKAR